MKRMKSITIDERERVNSQAKKNTMTSLVTIQSEYQQYIRQKEKLNISLKLQIYFTILETTLQPSNKQAVKNNWVSSKFIEAFKSLSRIQKQHFLLQNIKCIKQCQTQTELSEMKYLDKFYSPIQCIQTQGFMRRRILGMTHWTLVHFKFNSSKKNIKINFNGTTTTIDLRLYLIRQSKNYPSCFVLDACSEEAQSRCQRYAFSFQSEIYSQVIKQVTNCIVCYRNQKLLESINQNCQKLVQRPMELTMISANQKAIKFISAKILKSYLTDKLKSMQIIEKVDHRYAKFYEEKDLTIKISTNIERFYKLECNVNMSLGELKRQFIFAMSKKYIYLNYSQILEDYAKKYKVVFERYLIGNKFYELILLKQNNQNEQADIVFMRGMENNITENFLEFMLVTGISGKKDKTKLIIYAYFNEKISEISSDGKFIIEFLIQFYKMLSRSQVKDELKKHQDLFLKEIGLQQQVADQQFLFKNQEDVQKLSQKPKVTKRQRVQSEKQSNLYLTHKFILKPFKKQKPVLIDKHFIFTQWKRNEDGVLVCINQKMLQEQSKVVKHIVKSLGKKIFSSSVNVSLPVGIFKSQSHLTTIAKNHSYAPLVFDNLSKKSPLERIQAVIIYNISSNALGVNIGKPFNPILGETYQAWIDGCPVYVEQISHHPPISAYQFYGRGYQIYGLIEPKVEVSLNSIKGYTNFSSFIKFEDGTEIEFTFPKIMLKGFIIGDRQFTHGGKAMCFDKTNGLFCDINFGPRETGFFQKAKEPKDFLYGNIYKVTEQYLRMNAKKKSIPYPQQKDIHSTLSSFQGTWLKSIYFDGKQSINFTTDLPCKMIEEQYPLPSNSYYREDVNYFIQGDYEEAQRYKDELENMQRKDRKLRESYLKK